MLCYDKISDSWHLYEVKAKNSVDEEKDALGDKHPIDHIEDASFQAIILQENGLNISKIFLTHLNGEYVRQETLDIQKLLIHTDITEKVKSRENRTRDEMAKAKEKLFQEDEAAVDCKCSLRSRSNHCKTFGYSHVHVPPNSIYDIARISEKKLKELTNKEIFAIEDIPADFDLTPIQKNQVKIHKSQKAIIDHTAISKELRGLKYPLYFLDYEAYNPAIPMFKGFSSYEQIPFQFSLHVLKKPDDNLVHYEYLHELDSDPSLAIIQKLQKIITDAGTLIVWHKSFEHGINLKLAKRHPEHGAFLDRLNNMKMYDLEDIFKKQAYIHPQFKGKTSLKAVLPALIPDKDMGYENLVIQDGDTASLKWAGIIRDELTTEERKKNITDLKAYCKLDTIGMYNILVELERLLNAIE